MPKRTNPFQKLSASIMAVFHEPQYSVEESVIEKNIITGQIREIDIRLINRSDPKDRTMIECRDHRRPQGVEWLDALDGKSRSLGFSKVIAVSASGFYESAYTDARAKGISIIHLKKAEEIDWRKWFFAIDKIGIIIDGPVSWDVSFGIDADWPGENPDISDSSKVILVDLRDGTRVSIDQWVKGLLDDPAQIEQMRAVHRAKPNEMLKKVINCAPEMGFVIDGIEEFVPLAQLIINVKFESIANEIPLTHMLMGDEKILFGDHSIIGVPTRVTIHEKGKEVKLLLEQDKGKPNW